MDNFTVSGDLPGLNAQGVTVAKVSVALQVVAVAVANRPPVYTGPNPLPQMTVGVAVQLQGTDPDTGDVITWTADPAHAADVIVTSTGMLTAKIPLGSPGAPKTITVFMDDGKTP